MIKNNREDYMLNKFKYKDWTFVEYINPKRKGLTSTHYIIDGRRPFNPIYKTGSNERHIYDRIIDWFKHIEKEPPNADEVWDALTDEEAGEWFKNSKKDFTRWWGTLSVKLRHYYADRLQSGKSLLPDDLPGVPDVPTAKASLQMTIINDKLALSSVEISVLDKAREMIETVRGITDYEYRTTMRDGEELHTYIFDLK